MDPLRLNETLSDQVYEALRNVWSISESLEKTKSKKKSQ